jgi:hypothetical protein
MKRLLSRTHAPPRAIFGERRFDFLSQSRSLDKTYPIALSDVNERLILDVSNHRFDWLVGKTSELKGVFDCFFDFSRFCRGTFG